MESFAPGDTFDNRYVIERELGRGGFATVFLAHNTMTGAEVALKVLTPGRDGYDQGMRRRFFREARTLEQLDHPCIVRLLHCGEADGYLYMASEFVVGQDLSTMLETRGVFSTEEAVHVLEQALRALGAAHRAGIVHRDLKPENIRVSPTPEDPLGIKLLDFGIARPTDGGAPALTKTGELVGTPRYMAPEQLREQPATPASDIYALGLIGFELLLGRTALHGGGWTDQVQRLQTRHLVAVDRLTQIEPHLRAVLQRMTAVRPEARFQSASAVMSALDPTVALPQLESATPARGWALGAIVALLALASVIGAAAILGQDEETETAPASGTRSVVALTEEGEESTPPPIVDNEVQASVDMGAYASAGCDAPDHMFGSELQTYVPRSCEGRACPMVMAFYGNFMSPAQMSALLAPYADRHGFVVAAPYGGAMTRVWQESAEHKVDVATEAYSEAVNTQCIDRSRVYLFGYSDGIDPVVQVSCQPWVTAAATFGSSFRPSTDQTFEPGFTCRSRTRPFLWLHPRSSPQVPLETKPTCMSTNDVKLGYDGMTDMFRRLQKCKTSSRPVDLGPGMACEAWDCEVRLEACVADGGRLWPGTKKNPIDDFRGRCAEPQPTRADVGEAMWRFFESTEPLAPPPDSGSL